MSDNSEEVERQRKEISHQEALVAAKSGKAILSPDYLDRQFFYVGVGAVLFSSVTASGLALAFDLGPSVIFGLVVIVAFLLGAFCGLRYFHATHVVDESLERSVFDSFSAHRTTREMYVKK